MTAVRHILDQKGHQVWSLHPDDTVYDAIKMMADKDVGALLVLDRTKIVGIVTERDYARNVFLKGRASPQTLVGEIMQRNVVCVEPDKSIEECMAIMSAKRVRHLPVINDSQLFGIVSIGDLVKTIISDREFAIEQLEHYIRGRRRRPGSDGGEGTRHRAPTLACHAHAAAAQRHTRKEAAGTRLSVLVRLMSGL
jgi:CBS domain-containing protein